MNGSMTVILMREPCVHLLVTHFIFIYFLESIIKYFHQIFFGKMFYQVSRGMKDSDHIFYHPNWLFFLIVEVLAAGG